MGKCGHLEGTSIFLGRRNSDRCSLSHMSGQFDDADETLDVALNGLKVQESHPRLGLTFIDDDNAAADLDDGSPSGELDDHDDWDFSDDGDDWDDGAEIRVDDEDWEIAQKGECAASCAALLVSSLPSTPVSKSDFTKQYNRLRQHAAVQSGDTSLGKPSNVSKSAAGVVSLPPINRPKVVAVKAQQTADTNPGIETDQLTLLQKYNAHIHSMHEAYAGSSGHVGVNRKGPMATANQKDKADRATTEQVLDPRTRLILLKMVGRGVVSEVNGCISTGKEVRPLNRRAW